jgi:hypothetical protein
MIDVNSAPRRDNPHMNDTPRTSPSLNVEVTETVQSQSRDAIARGLLEFNARHVSDYKWTDLGAFVTPMAG